MISSLVAEFLATLGTFPVGEDTYPVELVAHLQGADRATVEDALIERVEQHDDVKAARSLAKLGAQRGLAAVQQLATRLDPGAFRDIAQVARLGLGDPDGLDAVLDVVRSGSETGRVAALRALQAEYPTDAAVDAVLDLLSDTNPILRGLAYDVWVDLVDIASLQLRLGQRRKEPRSPLRTLHMQLMSELPALYRNGAARARAITATLRAGDAPDLTYVASTPDSERLALARTLADPSVALDIAALQAWTGHDRRWLELLLCIRGEPAHRDPRAPAALADLGAAWTAEVLEESVEGLLGDHPYAVAVARALPRLWAD
jgi:hypothetical protein